MLILAKAEQDWPSPSNINNETLFNQGHASTNNGWATEIAYVHMTRSEKSEDYIYRISLISPRADYQQTTHGVIEGAN